MADAAVQFLLENLTHMLKDQYELISNVEVALRELVENKQFFKFFLQKFSGKKLRKDGALRILVEEIRNVIYDADDVIDTYITQAAEKKAKKTNFLSGAADLINIAKKVNDMCAEIKKTYGAKDKFDLVNIAAADDGPDENPLPQPTFREANDVVGLEDVVEEIVGYLTYRTQYLDVISIVGMPGLGKTTLTRKIYNDQQIITEFPTRLWVYVSSDFKEKEVFLSILKQLKTKLDKDEYGRKSTDDLAKEIAQELDGEKFLLVMDDVWELSDWEKLQRALPKGNKTGKVMITSRYKSVGRATKRREPHILRPMNIDESCELLRREVFNELEFPKNLAGVGKEIASKCAGLPLAIVVIGGVLTAKISRSVNKWKKVAESVTTFLNEEDPEKRMYGVISISYDKLPYHLKECFLYLGMFPEDSEIPAWKLIRMWIAEGLIDPMDEGITMEDRGEFYLDELISRNLVSVDELKSDGSVKTCRMHDMLRDFCKREGGNFLQEIKETGDGGLQSVALKDRRLSIHSKVIKFLSKNPKGTSVRSFVTFSEKIELPSDKFSVICAAFKLLRVLEAKPLTIGKIPNEFYHLIHLRYLVLSLKPVPASGIFSKKKPKHPSLPSALENLWNLQTLVVETTSRDLDINANIMNMTQLKHVKSSASITLANPDNSDGNEKLQTLCMVSLGSYTEAILGKALKLKKLGIRGKLASFLDAKTGWVNSLSKLTKLEKLKLMNDVFPEPASSGKIEDLVHCKFPTALKSLTLKATYLDWTNMYVLALLEDLEVLKLKDNAFEGPNWTVKQGGFSSLIYLHIERTDLVIWEAEEHHFPMLKTLKLHSCEKLKEIPSDIPQLKHLELKNCKEAAYYANKIAEAKKKIDPTFKISISLS